MGVKDLTDSLDIFNLFRGWQYSKEKLWVWQKEPNNTGKRPVHFAIVGKISHEKNLVGLIPTNTGGFRFEPKNKLFVFSEEKCLAMTVGIRGYDPEMLHFPIPKLVKFIAGDFINTLQLVERENEEAFKDRRELPRIQAKKGQSVTIRRFSEGKNLRYPSVKYILYDISGGGMAFIVDDPAEFVTEDVIELMGIENKKMDPPRKGIVRGVRELEDLSGFKVGIQFI